MSPARTLTLVSRLLSSGVLTPPLGVLEASPAQEAPLASGPYLRLGLRPKFFFIRPGQPSLGQPRPCKAPCWLGGSMLGGLPSPDFSDPLAGLGQPGSSFLSHVEASLGLRACLSYRWLGQAESLEGSQALSEIGLDRVLNSLTPPRQALLRRGFLLSLLRKDSRLLAGCLVLMLESTHFKRHRSLLFQLDKFLYGGAGYLSAAFGIRGLKIRISGKIGVGGNSKKRRSTLDTQGCGYATKSTRFSLAQAQARTPVGALGVLVVVAS